MDLVREKRHRISWGRSVDFAAALRDAGVVGRRFPGVPSAATGAADFTPGYSRFFPTGRRTSGLLSLLPYGKQGWVRGALYAAKGLGAAGDGAGAGRPPQQPAGRPALHSVCRSTPRRLTAEG